MSRRKAPTGRRRRDFATIKPHPLNPNFPLTYDQPKSVCVCGHTGDGKESRHAPTDLGTPGHGKCDEPGCSCEKFRWSEWTEDYAAVLKYLRANANRRAACS
jgi:hypothetical protein